MTERCHVAGSCSETPRTDAAWEDMPLGRGMHELAQALERELAAMTKSRDEYRSDYYAMNKRNAAQEQQLTRLYEQDALHTEAEGMQRQQIESLRSQLAEAGSRLSEGMQDTARMNWIQLHREDLSINRDLRRDKETIYVDCSVTGAMAYGATVREAIDVAISQEPK